MKRSKIQPPRFGGFRRLTPISPVWGLDRGRAVDRYYIERFLEAHAASIRGRVLEVGDDRYTRRFGSEVVSSDVLHVTAGVPGTTIVADLTEAESIPSGLYDCVICTQTLQLIYDLEAAVRTLCRILSAGGVALVTFPGISQISRYDMDRWGDYWRLTAASGRQLFLAAFPPSALQVEAQGNVLSSVAFLYGLAAEELTPEQLDHDDSRFELLITVAATKPLHRARRSDWTEGPRARRPSGPRSLDSPQGSGDSSRRSRPVD